MQSCGPPLDRTYVLCDVIGRSHLVPDGSEGTKAESPLIVRPVQEAAVYEFLRLRIPERPERRSGQAIDQTVNVPRTIFVIFRHQQNLKRSIILLPLVTDELH